MKKKLARNPDLPYQIMLISDRARTGAYARAIRKVIRPGDVVLDLGCGTGILGLLALQAGASHVHAVDRHPILYVAEKLYRENGFGDRVTTYHSEISELRLRKKVDLIVADLIGHAGVNESLIELHEQVLQFLKPGGRVVPGALRLFLVPASAPAEYRRHVQLADMKGYALRMETLRASDGDAARQGESPPALLQADDPAGQAGARQTPPPRPARHSQAASPPDRPVPDFRDDARRGALFPD